MFSYVSQHLTTYNPWRRAFTQTAGNVGPTHVCSRLITLSAKPFQFRPLYEIHQAAHSVRTYDTYSPVGIGCRFHPSIHPSIDVYFSEM